MNTVLQVRQKQGIIIDNSYRHGMLLTMSVKRNSGRFYNVVLVGEEAFGFLDMEARKRK